MNPTRLRAFVDPEGDGNPTKIALNVLRSALNPAAARVMAKKLYRRYRDQAGQITSDQNLSWIRANLQDFPSLARQINRELWEETEEFGRKLEVRASEILRGKQIARAGGAFYPCLYFLTRHMAPECIVETGVAAGYSSQALLEGIKHNGKGRLFSTDFPLFRDDDPVHAIGILVDEHLKEFWELHAEGDDLGLPSIIKKIPGVDIFHYDSDKTYAGRALAFSVVKSKLRPDSIFIMDDVQDNSWFHDYVKTEQRTDFAIFQFMGKYVGLAGPLGSR